MNVASLGLAPTPGLTIVKPEKPIVGVTLPPIHSATTNGNVVVPCTSGQQQTQQPSASRILIQTAQTAATSITTSPQPPVSAAPRISIAIRPRAVSTTAEVSAAPITAAAVPSASAPVTPNVVIPVRTVSASPSIVVPFVPSPAPVLATAPPPAAAAIPISIPIQIRRPSAAPAPVPAKVVESISIASIPVVEPEAKTNEPEVAAVAAVAPVPAVVIEAAIAVAVEPIPPVNAPVEPSAVQEEEKQSEPDVPIAIARNVTPPPRSLPLLQTGPSQGESDSQAQILVITREDSVGQADAAPSSDIQAPIDTAATASRSNAGTPSLLSPDRGGTPVGGAGRGATVFSAGNAALVLAGNSEHTLCGVCEQHVAEIHCSDCALSVCPGCNRTLHNNRKMRSHTRVPLVAGVPDTEHALRPSTAASNPGSGGGSTLRPGSSAASMRPGSSAGGRGSIDAANLSSPPGSARRTTARGSLLNGPLSPALAAQLSPHAASASSRVGSRSTSRTGHRSPSPAPTGAIQAVSGTPAQSATQPEAAAVAAAGGAEDVDSDPEDQTDALALAKELQAMSLQGQASCDQCHLAAAAVFCIDCMSLLCDGSTDTSGGQVGGCNKRIHKARAMARHRQVRAEERDEVLAQIEDEESVGQIHPSLLAASSQSPSNQLSPGTGPSIPRQSFIAPLSSGRVGGGLLSPASSHGRERGGSFGSIGSPSLGGSFPSPANSLERRPSGGNSNSLLTPTHGRPPLTPSSVQRGHSVSPGLHPTPPPGQQSSTSPSPRMVHHRSSSSQAKERPGTGTGTASASQTPVPLSASPDPLADGEPEFDPEFTSDTPTPSRPRTHGSIGSGGGGGGGPPGSASTRTTDDGDEEIDPSDLRPGTGTGNAAAAPEKPSTTLPTAVLPGMSRPCDNCDDQQAAFYCVECKMYLCSDQGGNCQQLIHRPTKMKFHQIFLIAPLPTG